MQILSQRDARWGNIKLGFSDLLIKDYGCTITSLAMIIGTTPDIVNDRLKAVNGFLGALIIWAKIPEAFPGIQQRRVWVYNNEDVKNNIPNVMVEVPAAPIGSPNGKHWVVFVGNQKCYDPWTGKERPTSDFTSYPPGATGYDVITGKWQAPSIGAVYYKGYDLTNQESMKVAIDVLVRVQAGELVDKSQIEQVKKDLEVANSKLSSAKAKAKEKTNL